MAAKLEACVVSNVVLKGCSPGVSVLDGAAEAGGSSSIPREEGLGFRFPGGGGVREGVRTRGGQVQASASHRGSWQRSARTEAGRSCSRSRRQGSPVEEGWGFVSPGLGSQPALTWCVTLDQILTIYEAVATDLPRDGEDPD